MRRHPRLRGVSHLIVALLRYNYLSHCEQMKPPSADTRSTLSKNGSKSNGNELLNSLQTGGNDSLSISPEYFDCILHHFIHDRFGRFDIIDSARNLSHKHWNDVSLLLKS
mmetsp:Transcript_2648/g.6089  ORF Transcript_2648/g.6089 Transcript_2648/m.6089 type:complete len:110 (+) Transcript_2648:87-416(+)